MTVINGEPKEVLVKEITYPNKKYVAFDGTEFDSDTSCVNYERRIIAERQNKFETIYYNSEKILFETTGDYVGISTFETEEDFNTLVALAQSKYHYITVDDYTLEGYLKEFFPKISFPKKYLIFRNDSGDYDSIDLISLELYKSQLKADLEKLEKF